MERVDYEAAVAFARQNGSISVSNIAATARVPVFYARDILREMVDSGIVGPPDATGRHKVIGVFADPGAQSAAENETQKADGIRVADLEAQVTRLKEAGRTVIAQRDNWKARAEKAEAMLNERWGAGAHSSLDAKFDQLKRFIAMEVHPDKAQGSFDKIIREAIFKMIWARIEQIERQT